MPTRNNISTEALENTVIPLSTKSMGGGALTSVFGYLSSSGTAVFIGIVVTVLGFAFNLYFQRKRYARELEEWDTKKTLLLEEERRKEEYHQAMLHTLRGNNE
jgi:predicted PurR-regulated permease PerM